MNKEIILITGANGMVAKKLSNLLSGTYFLRFLTRKKTNENQFEWDLKRDNIDINALKNVKHIIHLAGANIADKKWNKSRKKTILSSRINSSKLILNSLIKHKIKISSFISASAIGYYGTEITKIIYTERMEKGNDFLSDVCYKWEKEAQTFQTYNISERTVILRIGIVLSKKGGALKKMMTPIKYYMGTPLGNGNQYMPWIHIDDLCSMIKYSLENPALHGIFNAVAPEHITNKACTFTLANHMNKSIFLPNIPGFFIRLFFGERAALLLKGSRVSSKKIVEKGFKFRYNRFEIALQNL